MCLHLLFLWASSGAFLTLLGHLVQPSCEENTGSRYMKGLSWLSAELWVFLPCFWEH